MVTKVERIQRLKEKEAQIKAQIQALQARDAVKERKEDTRRKLLIGSVVQKMVKDGKLQKAQLDGWLDVALTSERDRNLFGLAAKSALLPAGEAGGAVSNGG